MVKNTLTSYIYNSIIDNWELESFGDYGSDHVLAFSDVASKINDLHNFFKKNGVKKGAKISLVGKNSTNWVVLHIATVTYGAIIVPILADFSHESIANIVNHSDSQFLFADSNIYEEISKYNLKNLEAAFSLSDFKNLKGSKDVVFSNTKMEKNDFKIDNIANTEIATIIYTSGTTGFSKGVMLSHNNLAANIEFARENIEVKNGDKQLSFLPLAHIFGCLFDFLFPFTRGVHVTFLTHLPTPHILLKALSEVRPNLILAVPLILEKIYYKQVRPVLDKPIMKVLWHIPILSTIIKKKLNKKISDSFGGNFYQFIVGGSALNENVERFFKDIKFKLAVGYGMTECAPLLSYAPSQNRVFRSCGRIINFLEIKIDSNDPSNEVGEIMVRGENVFVGYYKNDEATKEAFTTDGWFKTGDLGVVDEVGTIFLRGRSKNMLLGPSGENIYPEEMESIYNSYPYIMDSLILQRQNNLCALIFPDFDRMKADNVDEAKLKEILENTRRSINKKQPSFASVSSYEIKHEEFEKNPTKKIKRFLYR